VDASRRSLENNESEYSCNSTESIGLVAVPRVLVWYSVKPAAELLLFNDKDADDIGWL
jgi:hypothetical protein